MKLTSPNRIRESGSVLILTVILGAILLITLGSYYYLVRSENLMVAQSQAWNSSLAIAEAGIEEGMAQINVNFGTSNYLGSVGTNFGSLSAGIYGPKPNTNLGYALSISNDFPPTLYCTGTNTVAVLGQPVTRTVMVKTSQAYAFGNGITSQLDVDLKGNGIMVDSYDSSDPLHNTNGMYDASTRKAGGNVASTQGFVNVNGGNIYGKVYTAPGISQPTTGNNGTVGDLGWTGPGIEQGWWVNDYNATFLDVTPPFDVGGSQPVTYWNSTNTYLLGSGNYGMNGDLSLKSGDTLYVSGVASLYVTGNILMQSGSGSFVIIGPGAQLKVYVGTTSGSPVSATFTTVNTVGNAQSFEFFGLPSCTAMSWSGNSTYVGTVYAPEATFTLGGGGNNNYDYQGACVVQSIKMNGHFNFHYDENLARSGPTTGFIAYVWQEL